MSDKNYSPWPDKGIIWLTIRHAAWCRADPWYGDYRLRELKWLKIRRFWFPFLSVRTKLFHFYTGWKPILVPRFFPNGTVMEGDRKFYWWPVSNLNSDELAVQWSHRFGTGEIR